MNAAVPVLPPEEALRFFRRKGVAFGFDWRDVWQQEHVRAFTVAKAMRADLLEDIRAAVDLAIAEGRTLDEFRSELRPTLEAKGWWGRKPMTDPLTGETRPVQLGSPRRLRTIYNVNMRMAYQAGRWERMERSKAAFPFVRYVAVSDSRTRPQHAAWHGVIKPVGDPWWDTHYPPCGWNCRCTAMPVNQRMMERRGWEETQKPPRFMPESYLNPRTGEVTKIEAGISPGFNYNVGKAYLDDLAARPIPSGRRAPGEAAQLAPADRAAALLEPFGIDPAGAGDVFVDDVGEAIVITAASARDAAGYSAAELSGIARAITEPDEIRQLWTAAEDGQQLLTRRYVAGDLAVDVNKAGWRVAARGAGGEGERMTRAAIEAAIRERIAGPRVKGAPIDLGRPLPGVSAQLVALGIEAKARRVLLDQDRLIHINRRHGSDSRAQLPIGAEDIALARLILQRGEIRRGNPPTSKRGLPRIVVRATIGGNVYDAVFDVQARAIVPVSIVKRPAAED